jgi:hypothetical protein
MSPFLRPNPEKKQGDCEGELRGKIVRPLGYCFFIVLHGGILLKVPYFSVLKYLI